LDSETFFDVDRDAMENAGCFVARDGLVGLFSGIERLVAQLIDVGIELRLEGVNAAQGMLREFDGRNLARANGRCGVNSGPEIRIEFTFHKEYKGLLSLPGNRPL
jgi:hypothetical protein